MAAGRKNRYRGQPSERSDHGGRAFSVVTFAVWEEGFVVHRGNPKAIREAEDLANPNVRFINREEGSGSRRLFDTLLDAAGMKPSRVKGSDTFVPGHLAAAWAVDRARRIAASRRVPPRAVSAWTSCRSPPSDSSWCCTSAISKESRAGRFRYSQSRAFPAATGNDRGL